MVMEELVMAHKKKHIKKHIRKPKTWVDEFGVTHIKIEIDRTKIRDEFHFNTQLNTRMQIIESKKFKKPKHKKKLFEEE